MGSDVRGSLIQFMLLAYAVSWLFWIPLLLGARGWIDVDLPLALLFNLGGIGPAVAAIALTYSESRGRGVAELLRRIVAWRAAGWVYLAALTIPAVVVFVSLGLLLAIGAIDSVELLPAPAIVGGFLGRVLLLQLEETGWRGFAQARLQDRRSPLTSALLVGAMWGPWHLPLMIAREQPALQIVLFLVAVYILAVLIAWLFNAAAGSLLIAGIAHSSYNTAVLSFFPSLDQGEQLALSGLAIGVGVAVALAVVAGTRGRLGL